MSIISMNNKKSLHMMMMRVMLLTMTIYPLLVLYTLSKIHLMKIRKFSLHSDESLLINIVDISSSRKSRGLETNDIVEDGNV